MKRITFLLFFILPMLLCYGQKCKFDSIVDSSDSTTLYYVKNFGNYSGPNNNMYIQILKSKNNYFLKGSYTRMFSKNFKIESNHPLVFSFTNGEDFILYPQDMSESSWSVDLYTTLGWWNQKCDVLYKVKKEQLIFLMNNVPTQVKVHFSSEKKNDKNKDNFGNYECLCYKIKYWHKKFVKVIECSLSMK